MHLHLRNSQLTNLLSSVAVQPFPQRKLQSIWHQAVSWIPHKNSVTAMSV